MDLKKLLNDDQNFKRVIRPIFSELDENNRGYIDENLLAQVLAKLFENFKVNQPSANQIRNLMSTIQPAQKGKVSFEEYVSFVKAIVRGTDEESKVSTRRNESRRTNETAKSQDEYGDINRLINNQPNLIKLARPAFNSIDINNSGSIDEAQLLKALGSISSNLRIQPLKSSQVSQVLKKLDKGKDGLFTFDEFIFILRDLLKVYLVENSLDNPVTNIRNMLDNNEYLSNAVRSAFQEVDNTRSGYIDENDLYQAMVRAARIIGIRSPNNQEAHSIMLEIHRNRDGNITFDEYVELLRIMLRRQLNELTAPKVSRREQFEEYLEETGISVAFQLIFTEIIAKNIDPLHVFSYSAMRLKELGKEVAHLLPNS